jgi:hypothetical protein
MNCKVSETSNIDVKILIKVHLEKDFCIDEILPKVNIRASGSQRKQMRNSERKGVALNNKETNDSERLSTWFNKTY